LWFCCCLFSLLWFGFLSCSSASLVAQVSAGDRRTDVVVQRALLMMGVCLSGDVGMPLPRAGRPPTLRKTVNGAADEECLIDRAHGVGSACITRTCTPSTGMCEDRSCPEKGPKPRLAA